MRPTGALHLGHYHGALKNWVRLQAEFECFYFVADWHALTTHYEERGIIEKNVYDMVIDWLAAGIDPDNATIFIQSRLPEHAELFTLLAMGTPLGWLERVPTYKDQMEKLKDRDLATYGFLGYPLLQAADILIYRAAFVPVGEDQSSHVELTREVARRFNHLYGREPNFDELARNVVKKLGKDARATFEAARKTFQEEGGAEALQKGAPCVARARRSAPATASDSTPGHLRHRQDDPARAAGAAHRGAQAARPRRHEDEQELRQRDRDARGAGRGREEDPRACRPTRRACGAATRAIPRSARCGSCIRSTPTRRRRTGSCKGCTTAGIGCLECKQPVIDAIVAEQKPWRERAGAYLANPKQVHWIVEVGTERARDGRAGDDARRARGDGPRLLSATRAPSARAPRLRARLAPVVRFALRARAASARPSLTSLLSVPANSSRCWRRGARRAAAHIATMTATTGPAPRSAAGRTARTRPRPARRATSSGRTPR